jgi:hypothetical protein
MDPLSTFALCRLVIGDSGEVPISKQNFEDITRARKILSEITSLEEKFIAFCESFKELELFLFHITLKHMLYNSGSSSDFFAIKTEFGRLALALLASGRLYIDSVCPHIEAVSGGKLSTSDTNAILSQRYDASFCYRVIYAVRNFIQHRAFPVHSFWIGSTWDESHTINTYTAKFTMSAENLDSKFKSSVRKEIEHAGGKVDLKECLRTYFADVCDIHAAIRFVASEYRSTSLEIIKFYQEEWVKVFPGTSLRAVAACELSDGVLANKNATKWIDPQVDEYRVQLETKTAVIVNMKDRRVAV